MLEFSSDVLAEILRLVRFSLWVLLRQVRLGVGRERIDSLDCALELLVLVLWDADDVVHVDSPCGVLGGRVLSFGSLERVDKL